MKYLSAFDFELLHAGKVIVHSTNPEIGKIFYEFLLEKPTK